MARYFEVTIPIAGHAYLTVEAETEAEAIEKGMWTNLDRPAKRFDHPVGRTAYGHPTSKPLPLIKWCLDFLPKTGVILDPFSGSGTTAVACVQAGRNFIGIELNAAYFDAACARVQDAYDRPDMFIAPRSPEPVQEGFAL